MSFPFQKQFDKAFTGDTKWYIKYLWFILFCIIFGLLIIVPALIKEGFPKTFTRTRPVFIWIIFFITGLFVFLQINDKSRKIKYVPLKILVALLQIVALFVWLIVSVCWLISILDI